MQLFRFSTQWVWLGVASLQWPATIDSAITCTGEITFSIFFFTNVKKSILTMILAVRLYI